MAKNKYIPTPEIMWEHFCNYRNEVKSNPIKVVEQKKTSQPLRLSAGVDTNEIKELLNEVSKPVIVMPIERPLTLEGFENWCADNDIIADLSQYFANTEGRYTDYQTICARIRRTIRQDQIEGGMAGIYNASITQRLNNLVEKQDVTTNGKDLIPPMFGNNPLENS